MKEADEQLREEFNRWAEDGFEPILHQWQMRADGIGEEIDVHMGEKHLHGTFDKVDAEGRLVVRQSDQTQRAVSVNEYFALNRQ